MSFLHSHSSECMKSELDLFTLPPTQTSIEDSYYVHHNPVSTLTEDAPIEFVVPGQGEEYIDLSQTQLKIRARIVKADGTAVATDDVGPVNNFLHSMFSSVDVSLNQKPVSSPNNFNGYRSCIESELNYGSDAKNSHLQMGLWAKDTPGEMDSAALVDGVVKNAGLKARQEFTKGGKIFDMVGHLHCDIFNQDKFLLNGVEMRVRLIRAKDAFCLMDHTIHLYKVQIMEASLIIRRVKVSPAVLLAHAKTLSKTTAKYPFTRVEIKTYVLHKQVRGETVQNLMLGQLAKRLILMFTDNESFNGSRVKNPYNFGNYGINYVCLHVDGRQIPSKPLQPNFGTDCAMDVEAYSTLFSGTGLHFSDHGNDISRAAYPNGYCFFAFDLTPDLSAGSASHWNLVKSGSVRLEVRFDKPTDTNINCIVYAEYDNLMEIDSTRQVMVDYSG